MLPKILNILLKLKIYIVVVLPIDSEDLGEPVARPRVYLLLLRRDVVVLEDPQKIKLFVAALAHAAHAPVQDHIGSRLFLNDSPWVRNYINKLKDKILRLAQENSRQKWKAQHQEFLRAKRLRPVGEVSACLPSKRMRESFGLWQQHAGPGIIGNFSQSIERASVRTDGVCPTITPKGMLYVEGRGVDRLITPREKLAAQLFPLHQMAVPKDFPEEEYGILGGNTMHLKSVGLALLIGLSLVDCAQASARTLHDFGKAPPAIVLPSNVVRRGL